MRTICLATALLLLWCSSLDARAELPALSKPSAQESPKPDVADTTAAEKSGIDELKAEIESWQQKAAAFREAQVSAPKRLAEVNAALHRIRSEKGEIPDSSWSLEQLVLELALAEQELAVLQVQQSELDAEPERRTERRKTLPKLIADARAKLRELDSAQAAEPRDAESQELSELRKQRLESEIGAYESELNSLEARNTLLARRRDHAAKLTEEKRKYINLLRIRLKTAKRDQVLVDTERARQLLEETATLPPKARQVVRELAERNLALTDLFTGDEALVEKISTIDERLARARTQVSAVQTELTRLKAKVDASGLADSVGAMLRRERANAPDVGMYRRFIKMRADKIGEAELQQLRLAEQRDQLSDVESRVREAMAEMDDNLSADERLRVETLLRELLANQLKYMDALIADHDEYFQKLVEFDAEQRELIEHSEQLIDFINERVLWVPSGSPIDSKLPSDLSASFRWLTDGRYWKQLGRAARYVFVNRTGFCLLLLVALVALIAVRRRLEKKREDFATMAADKKCISFAPTAKALLLSLLIGAGLPFVFYYIALLVGQSLEATQFSRCISRGARSAALLFASLAILRELLRDRGVATAHLGWSVDGCGRLSHHLLWLSILVTPAAFLVYAFEAKADDQMRESLARVAFIISMIGTGLFGHLVLREGGGFWEILRSRSNSKTNRSVMRVLYLSSIAIPLALAMASAIGFYWTALQLSLRVYLTYGLLFALFVCSDLLRRWIVIARRNLAAARSAEVGPPSAEAGPRSAEVGQSRETSGEQTSVPQEPETGAESAGEALDLATISLQTERLTSSALTLAGLIGLGAIWAQLLPAAGILRKVELWQVRKQIEPGPGVLANAEAALDTQWVAITLADLAVALLIIIIGLILLRNLPGLLEVTLFRRLQAGERYAFATILKYAIAITGVTLALGAIGITWESIQWLVAAIGLGLGFGLQEIFANFISGLLILLERPIRVGDTVTVGDISGNVTRIHIRATWITTFDRKELVVPNKEFVTSKLVNWSLSDPTLRLRIPVGIAYGSDIGRAESVLSEVAANHPLVLQEPPPRVLFLEFGDSSLGFELQVYVGDPEHRLGVCHDLHKAIDKAFREANIEIAFPQREVRLKGLTTLSSESEATKKT